MTNPWGPAGPPQQPRLQFPQQQFPQQQFPQLQFTYPPLPPRRSRAGLVSALLAVVAVIVAGVVILIAAPWASDGGRGPAAHERVTLAHGVAVDVDVPVGWRVEAGMYDGDQALMLLPESEDRRLEKVFADLDTMDDGDVATTVHAVVGFVDACGTRFASVGVGGWDHDTNRQNSGDVRFVAHRAVTGVDGSYCFGMTGVDYGAAAAPLASDGSDLVQQLIDDEAITAAKAA